MVFPQVHLSIEPISILQKLHFVLEIAEPSAQVGVPFFLSLGGMSRRSDADDERTPLLAATADRHSTIAPTLNPSLSDESQGFPVLARVSQRLYISHFLSTWNSRVFEFGAVLYLASIFPGTLMPMSVYALTRGLSAILFSSAVGQYIDTGNRLQVVRLSIGRLVHPASTCFAIC